MRFALLGLISTFSIAACSSGTAGNSSGASGAGASSGAGGGTGTGGDPTATSSGTSVGSGATGSGGAMPTSLLDRIHVSTVTVSSGVKDGVQNWGIWGQRDLGVAPVFTAPLASCETLVCFTTGSANGPTARVVRLDAQDALVSEIVTEAGVECRGLAAGAGGQFAALLWSDAQDAIAIHRYDAAGNPIGATPLVNTDNLPDDFRIGESRLEFGNGQYGAYYHVHSLSGHEGDTLKWVDAASGAESTVWDWGCSHSMSNLLRFNSAVGDFMPACVTDCYPGTSGNFSTNSIGGIYLNHNDEKVMDVDAGCNGSVAAELGSAALSPDGWKMIFNAHQAPVTLGQNSYDESTMNQDIGFSSVTGAYLAGAVVWLTNTGSIDEMDSSISRFEPTGSGEQYLAGWVEGGTTRTHRLALLNGAGGFVEGPIDVSAIVQWGRRDDPFRQHHDGDVVWAWFDAAGSTTLHIARVESGVVYTCQ